MNIEFDLRTDTIRALYKAKDFYERCFEVSGGCDHSVGICVCSDLDDYNALCGVLTRYDKEEINND